MRRVLLFLMMAASFEVQAAAVLEALKPAQTLDALQRVQDSIATGDARALPLQKELISIMDKSFAAALNGSREPLDPELVLAYALVGGSRTVFSSYVSRTKFEQPRQALVEAVTAYLKGDADKALLLFEKVEVQLLGARLAPFVALAKGTVNIRKHPDVAIRNFDLARIMAPATLIEEVALRRAITMHSESGDSAKFLKASEQYARRFIQSPYAVQFVESFVAGTARMASAIPETEVDDALHTVSGNMRNALYMRLAREAVIAGHLALAAHAATEALRDGELSKDPVRAAQIDLYALVPELTKLHGPALSKRIAEIDDTGLPKADRPLLDAVRRIAEAIGQPFEAAGAQGILVPDKVAVEETKVGIAVAAQSANSADEIEKSIASHKEKLSAIDALLGAAN